MMSSATGADSPPGSAYLVELADTFPKLASTYRNELLRVDTTDQVVHNLKNELMIFQKGFIVNRLVWEMERFGRGDLKLHASSLFGKAQRVEVQEAIGRFGSSGHADTAKTAAQLEAGIREVPETISWECLVSLSRWCHTAGPYKTGRAAAQEVSMALFGAVLPNLGRDTGSRTRLTAREARQRAAAFLDQILESAQEEMYGRNLALSLPVLLSSPGIQGSPHCLLHYVNSPRKELEHHLMGSSPSLDLACVGIEWQLGTFLPGTSVSRLPDPPFGSGFEQFWPTEAPSWDGLGLALGAAGWILVRARSYPTERPIAFTESDPLIRSQIDLAFGHTQGFMGVSLSDWKTPDRYELGVDVTMLYFLNEVVQVPTWLALVYFVDDRSSQPTSLVEWRKWHRARLGGLGLHSRCRLLDRIIPVFLLSPTDVCPKPS